ncbi:Threonine/homoserine/homoserine lactone efflux protein [Candidatus Kryptobacter tengchongensis]|nr:Threonine/homoserine/homoserine lactone efflux protein [Candidatus Kryptobacter tengchongensis]
MIALFAGIIFGVIISVPIGPINLTILTKGMRDGFKPAFWTGVGSATMEFLYCLLAMFGMGALVEHSLGNIIVQIFAFLILFIFGFRNLIVHPKKIYNGEFALNNGNGKLNFIKKHHIHNTFLVGAVLYALNPTFIIFWITIAGFVQSTSLIGNSLDNFLFALGVGLGVVLWFYLLLKFVHNIIEFRTKTVARFHRISGIIILGFAFYLAFEILKKLI